MLNVKSLDNRLSFGVLECIADTQKEIFEYAASHGYKLDSFIRGYMFSNFCNNEMDSEDSYYHFKTPEVCFSCILDELGDLEKGVNNYFNPGWTGKMYRYLAYYLKRPSFVIFKLISPKELDNLSISYESFDDEYTVNDILQRLNTSA